MWLWLAFYLGEGTYSANKYFVLSFLKNHFECAKTQNNYLAT